MKTFEVVGVRHAADGTIEAIKLDNGEIIDLETAYVHAEYGKIPGYVPIVREGRKYIRGGGDGERSNNLDQLPEI
jgi:hypothetical protein